MMQSMGAILILFLSTLSLRRATLEKIKCCCSTRDFYPRSPCGERHTQMQAAFKGPEISIHALLAESDPETVPRRPDADISIHALLAESDITMGGAGTMILPFLSTLSLRRATGILGRRVRHRQQFLSTLSLRRATADSVSQWTAT